MSWGFDNTKYFFFWSISKGPGQGFLLSSIGKSVKLKKSPPNAFFKNEWYLLDKLRGAFQTENVTNCGKSS